jgi:hypothetical protein
MHRATSRVEKLQAHAIMNFVISKGYVVFEYCMSVHAVTVNTTTANKSGERCNARDETPQETGTKAIVPLLDTKLLRSCSSLGRHNLLQIPYGVIGLAQDFKLTTCNIRMGGNRDKQVKDIDLLARL